MELTLVAVILLAVLLALLACGLWIGFSLLLAGAFAIAVFTSPPVGKVVATTVWGHAADWTLTALPMFIWMGEILFRSKLSEGMFAGLAGWFSRVPGRLLHVPIAGCALFSAISGSSTATCATVSRVTLPELLARGYPDKVVIGALASAGTLGILIPPSIIMIVYAVAADVSIIQLFIAGIVPGLLVALLFAGYVAVWAMLHPAQVPQENPLPLGRMLRQSRRLLPCLALIAGVFAGLFSGVATATEVGALGVAAALGIAAANGTLTLRSFSESLAGTVHITCMIGLILVGANVLSTAMALTGIPVALADWVKSMQLSPYLVILALSVVYLLLGTALEGVSMILLTTSIALPMAQGAGFDPVWFGIFIVIMTELSTLSPPVGFNLFVMQTITGRSGNFVALATLPFFLILLFSVALFAVWPELVTWLPQRLMQKN